MDLAELVRTQREFDKAHGWVPDTSSPATLIDALQHDIVGLVGEIGEFANLVKKVARDSALRSIGALVANSESAMKEELVDTLIYVVRLAADLNVDLEAEYMRKLELNQARYLPHAKP